VSSLLTLSVVANIGLSASLLRTKGKSSCMKGDCCLDYLAVLIHVHVCNFYLCCSALYKFVCIL